MEHKLLIGGRWREAGPPLEVVNKYTGELVATVATASEGDVDEAIEAAARSASVMADMPSHSRAELLVRASELLRERKEDFARTIAAEAGKALKYSRTEVDRSISVLRVAAEEAKRIHGETVPMDAVPVGEGYFGMYLRRPVGVVAAVTPFNFPLLLVVHKVAPALAAGNSLVLKPASSTPVTAVKLCEVLCEAGLPMGAANIVVGSGGAVGERLVADERVGMVTFTGSPPVARRIAEVAGIKKITLELGNNSPVVIEAESDLGFAARRCAYGAYYNSGQVCLSVQRIYCQRQAYEAFVEQFIAATRAMVVGDPLDERVDVGPMIDEGEAKRIEEWVKEAEAGGAHVLTGNKRDGSVYSPTVLADVEPEMKVVAREAFAPIASIRVYDEFEDALRQADATTYGLQAGVFTRDINHALLAIRRLNFGGVIINDVPSFRADHMPYGGNRQSGLGREGPRYAIEEMTNIQMVAIRAPM